MAITVLGDVKDYLGILDDTYSTQINRLIPLIEQHYLEVRNVPFDTDDLGDLVYPIGADMIAAEMIGYKLKSLAGGLKDNFGKDVSSESLDAYSVSYIGTEGSVLGYPRSLISQIKRYIDGR